MLLQTILVLLQCPRHALQFHNLINHLLVFLGLTDFFFDLDVSLELEANDCWNSQEASPTAWNDTCRDRETLRRVLEGVFSFWSEADCGKVLGMHNFF